MAVLTDYRFGRVRVDGREYHRDLLIFADEILYPWVRREGHALYPDDLTWIIDKGVRVLVIGTGAFGRLRVPEETRKYLNERGITLVSLPTREAIAEYNRICQEANMVGCGLHLTC